MDRSPINKGAREIKTVLSLDDVPEICRETFSIFIDKSYPVFICIYVTYLLLFILGSEIKATQDKWQIMANMMLWAMSDH